MGSTAAALLRLLPLLLAPLGLGSSKDVNALVGTTVHLKVIYTGKSTGYTWTKGTTRVADWDEPGKVTYYETLKGRCELNTSTGVLTIRDLKEEDSASYKGEAVVNNIYESSNYDLRVYPNLTKPTVTCFVLSGNFTLSCDHQPDPPTYTWRKNGVVVTATDPNYWLSNDNKDLTLTHAKAPFQSLKCVVQNPVSNNSAPIPLGCFEGLINNEEKTPRRRWVLIFPVIGSLAVGLLVFKRTRENQKNPRDGVDAKSEEERRLTQSKRADQEPGNGVPQSSSEEGGNTEQGSFLPVSDPKNDGKEEDDEQVNHRSSSQNSLSSGGKRDETDTKV
ncbi:CD48 antigen-like isoform X2 [Lissotriton helveticus]